MYKLLRKTRISLPMLSRFSAVLPLALLSQVPLSIIHSILTQTHLLSRSGLAGRKMVVKNRVQPTADLLGTIGNVFKAYTGASWAQSEKATFTKSGDLTLIPWSK